MRRGYASTSCRQRCPPCLRSSHAPPDSPPKTPSGGLSEREREIALLIAQGKTNREIAEAFSISKRTVETHLGRIYSKLGFNTRPQLAAWVVEQGLARPSLS